MSFAEIQREIVALPPEEQRRLMGFLAGLQLSREEGAQLRTRFSDERSSTWIPADEMEKRLREDR